MFKKAAFLGKSTLVLIMLLAFLFNLSACNVENEAIPSEPNPPEMTEDDLSGRNLRIRLTADSTSDWFSSFPCEELGGNFNEGLTYNQVQNVTIEINGSSKPLEQALRDGDITEEEIFYYARRDAAAGICQERIESDHGLTNFFYTYPEYTIILIYDLLETPDDQQHLISLMLLHPSDVSYGPIYKFRDPETWIPYHLEDWGLTVELISATPAGVTVKTTQSEGQQIGQLHVVSYVISSGEDLVERKHNDDPLPDDLPITMDGSGEIYIDWTDVYGELPSGDYTLTLDVMDYFDESQIHPLMLDYMDYWVYTVEFSIP